MRYGIKSKVYDTWFRSHLEAQWAVFLTELDMTWQYEPQGYVSDGVAYLPDFYVFEWRCWLEIKPVFSTKQINALTAEEWKKVNSFALNSDDPLIVAFGFPSNADMLWLGSRGTKPRPGFMAECGNCGCLYFAPHSSGKRIVDYHPEKLKLFSLETIKNGHAPVKICGRENKWRCAKCRTAMRLDCQRLLSAAQVAQNMRFETA